MAEPANKNIEMLQELFGSDRLYAPAEGDVFSVDGIEFVCDYASGSTAERFFIVKQAEHVRQYRALCARFRKGTIVELGIAEGGGTVLTALEAAPTRLVAVDLESQRLAALDEFIEARGLQDVVRPRYGVDQGDRTGLAQVIDEEVDGAPIDLVVDDASHLLGFTRTSFETLFPKLRPGGIFAIEDWNADHVWRDAILAELRAAPPEEKAKFLAPAANESPPAEPRRPLSDLAVELLLARASSGDAVASVTVNEYWVLVERGPADLDPTTFRVADLFNDHFGYLG